MNESMRRAGETFSAWFRRRCAALSERTPEVVTGDDVPAGFKLASVLAPFWEAENGRVELALTLRPSTMSSHRGQVSFPGGRVDDADESLVHTALRESEEELGLEPSQVSILARLDDAWSIQGYLVAPHVGWLAEPPVLRPSATEVERVIVADVERLMDPALHRAETMSHRGLGWTVHYFDYDGDVIWGMTGGILDRLFRLVRGEPIVDHSVGAASLRRYLEARRGE